MPRLGMVGTLVWDTIHGPEGDEPVSDWGGIAYSLAAWEAVAPPGWSVVPIIKIGGDLRDSADRFLARIESVSSLDFVCTVPEENNRVSLFYHDRSRRCERLTGGVPGWSAEEIEPAALSCDAWYVNFISGWELDRASARTAGELVDGPAWCDVHSLILGVGDDGVRQPRPLEDRAGWLAPFDYVQVNEDELEWLAPGAGSRAEKMRALLSDGPEAVFLTLGSAGVEWLARMGRGAGDSGGPQRGVAPVEAVAPPAITDPTGCGDVWGVSCLAGLIGGISLPEAVRAANRLASAAARSHGTAGLREALTRVATTEQASDIE